MADQSRLTRRRFIRLAAGAPAAVLLSSCTVQDRDRPDPAPPSGTTPETGWRIVWEDRFDGTSLNTAWWTAMDYGGNRDLGELQYNDPAMVSVSGGNLVLKAKSGGRNGYTYSAGGITSQDKLNVGPYGRLTTRQYVSSGDGIGVGVCLYGVNINEVGWPACGEIDATEIALARGANPFASLHGPGYSGGAPITATRQGNTLVGRWAEHTLMWEPDRISWAIDGETYQVAEASDPRAAGGWPFDQPFFITIVMTAGSGLSGPVNESTWPYTAEGVREDPYAVFDFIRFEQWQQ